MSLFESQSKLLFSNVLGLVAPRKLDTAIRASTVTTLMNHLANNQLSYDEKFFLNGLTHHKIDPFSRQIQYNHHVWCHLMTDTLLQKHSHDIKNDINSRILTIIKKNLKMQASYLAESIDPQSRPNLISSLYSWIDTKTSNLPVEIIKISSLVYHLSCLVEAISSSMDVRVKTSAERLEILPPKCYYEIEALDMMVIWSETLCYIQYGTIKVFVPKPYLLLMHNKASDCLSVLLYAYFNEGSSLDENAFEITVKFMLSLSSLHQKHQNKAMEISKSIEALGVGITLIESDGETNKVFLDEILNNIFTSTQEWIPKETFFQLLKAVSVPMRHELMCLSKIFGHPFVDMEAGAKKLFRKTTMKVEFDDPLIKNCVRYAKRSFIKNYILKHGRWPQVKFLGKIPSLLSAWSKNRDPDSAIFTTSRLSTQIEDYDFVEIEQSMTFNNLDNIIPYLKDKTISVLQSQVIRKFINQETMRMSWEDTRLLLMYLLHDIDAKQHQEYIKAWCELTPIDFNLIQDYLVIRIVPKEKELKTEFRGFGCKTYEDRMRTICQELNVADYMDSYCNEQALTLSELDIMKRLCSFRRIEKAYKGYTPIYIVIDASAWNNKFRHDTVFPVMNETLDKIFNVNIFSRTMLAYEHSLIYVPDHSITYWWQGQQGGIEGLNQYTWDTVYLPQIRACLHDTGYDPKLFAKGDDLRAVVLVPPDLLQVRTINEIRLEIVTELTENMKKLGHDINVNESYGSLKYFAFSKIASLGTMELPEGMRKIQKAYGANNAFLPLLDDYIGSSYSVCHSACRSSSNPIACYAIGLFWASWHLLHHRVYKDISCDKLSTLLLIPGILGGFPIIYLHNIWIRAESDLLSPFLGLLSHLKVYFPENYQIARRFLEVDLIPTDKAFRGLLIDPYSLPIKKPVTASNVLRRLIVPALRLKIRNTAVLELLKYAESSDTESLIRCLASCNVYQAKILAAIYAASPVGLLDELIRKFESGRSICDILILRWGRKGAASRLLRVMRADAAVHRYRTNKLAGVSHESSTDLNKLIEDLACPAESAQRIRSSTWGRPVEGITMPPLQHQIKILLNNQRPLDQWELRNSFQIITHESSFPISFQENAGLQTLPIYSVGERKPFCGFATRAGKTTPTIKIIESNEVLDKVKTLIDLLDWVNLYDEKDGVVQASNLPVIIKKLIAVYIPTDPDSLLPFQSGKKAGTIEHHVRCRQFRESIMPNILGNIYTRSEGVTNCHVTLRQSSGHYRVNYLFIYCFATSLVFLPEMVQNRSTQPSKYYVTTTSCIYCSKTIVESAVFCDLSLVHSYNPQPLHTLALSTNAVEIIKRSLEGVQTSIQKKGKDIAQITRENIETSLVQYYVTTFTTNKQRVSDFAYSHPCDMESLELMGDTLGAAAHLEIGFGELKRIRTEAFLNYAIILVIQHVYTSWPDNNHTNISAYITSMPSEVYSWYTLVDIVHEMGRLTDLVQLAYLQSGIIPSACQESKSAATTYLGIACYTIYHKNVSLRLLCTYFTNMEIVQLNEKTQRLGFIMKHRWAKAHLYPQLSHLSHSPYEIILNYYDVLLIFWACPLLPGVIVEQIASSELNTIFDIDVLQISSLTPDDLDNVVDEKSLPKVTETLWELNVFRLLPDPYTRLEDLIHDIDSFERARDYLSSLNVTTTLSVLYTTLSECINLIRTKPIVVPKINSLDVHIGDAEAKINSLFNGHTHNRDRVLYISRYNGHSKDLVLLPEEELFINMKPFGTEIPSIRSWYIYRSQGFGTSAPSKLISILTETKLLPLPNNSCYWTLGDGFGGFAACINKLVTSSVIVFNTLIEDPHHEHHPSAIYHTYGDNHIDYQAMQNNISDLTNKITVDTLYKDNPYSPVLITCDAQTINMDMKLRKDLIRNVLYSMLNYGANNCVLIIKLYYEEMDINLQLIHELISHSCLVYMIKPEGSGANQEIYLVAQRLRKDHEVNYNNLLRDLYPPSSACIVMQRQLKRLMSKAISDRMSRNIPLNGYYPQISKVPQISIPEAISRLQTYCGITISEEDWEQMRTIDFYQYINRLKNLCRHAKQATVNEMNRARQPTLRTAQEWDCTTVAHKKVLINRFMSISGFAFILDRYEEQKDFTNTFAYTGYVHIIDELSYDMILPQLHIPDTIKTSFIFRGEPWQPYLYFLRGIEYGMMLMGYQLFVQRT